MQAEAKRAGLVAAVKLIAPRGEFLRPNDELFRREAFRSRRRAAVDLHHDDVFFDVHVNAQLDYFAQRA